MLALTGPGNFQLDIELRDAARLSCVEAVRVVPGKRVVCKGVWQQQAVYAKLFLGRDAKRYALRDAQGAVALANAHIVTPALLYQGQSVDGAVHVLIFAAIANSVSADQALTMATPQQRLALCQLMVRAIAQHHEAGLLQTDLYPKNFLVQGDQLYTIDGDAIRRLRAFRTRHDAIENLAVLISKFDVVDVKLWLPTLVYTYEDARKNSIQISPLYIKQRSALLRSRVVRQYTQKKVFRQCTDVAVSQTWQRFMAINRQFDVAAINRALMEQTILLSPTKDNILKKGNTCTVFLGQVDATEVVIKRYNIKSIWHGFNRAFRPSRAAIAWSNAYRLMMYGLATATPIALMEQRFGPLRREAYLLAEYIDAPDVADYFCDAGIPGEDKKKTAESMVNMFYKLNLLKITHGDFKASNIKIVSNAPVLIDLDSMREHRCRRSFLRQHVRDLRRFMRNWQEEPAVSQMLQQSFNEFYPDVRMLEQAGISIKQSEIQ